LSTVYPNHHYCLIQLRVQGPFHCVLAYRTQK